MDNHTEKEILIFTIGSQVYGAMVEQVREILMTGKLEPVPNGHHCIEGLYRPRDVLITVINLPKYMNVEMDEEGQQLFIVADVENFATAFLVNKVLGIEKINLDMVEKQSSGYLPEGVNRGVIRVNGELVTILDFQVISYDIIN